MDRKAIAIVAHGDAAAVSVSLPRTWATVCVQRRLYCSLIAVPPTHTKLNSGDTATVTLAKFSRPLEAPLWTLSVSALTACLYVTPAK